MPAVPISPMISIIIVNWNGLPLLDECLRSLASQSYHDFETILVDNGSTDGSAEWLQTQHPRVRLLRLEANLGFSAGNNAGYKIAKGRFIVLLNNDTKVETGWLEALYRRIISSDDIAACDSKILYYDRPDIIWSSGGKYSIAGSVMSRWAGEKDGREHQRSEDVFIAVACAAIYRRQAIERIGLFDEDYFAGYEDVDWSFRAHLLGYRIVNEPAARVYHKASATQVHNSPFFVYNGQRNVSVTFLKNMPAKLMFRYLPLHLVYIAGSFLYFAKIGKAWPFLRAKLYVASNLLAVMRKRKAIQDKASASSSMVDNLLERKWLSAKANKMLDRR